MADPYIDEAAASFIDAVDRIGDDPEAAADVAFFGRIVVDAYLSDTEVTS